MYGRANTAAVGMIVAFVIAILATNIATGTLTGLLDQSSRQSDTDSLSDLASTINQQCRAAQQNAYTPVSSGEQINFRTLKGLSISDSKLRAEYDDSETQTWDLDSGCTYDFDVNGDPGPLDVEEEDASTFAFEVNAEDLEVQVKADSS
jgi:type II secretory pathway pseudopilin PulG